MKLPRVTAAPSHWPSSRKPASPAPIPWFCPPLAFKPPPLCILTSLFQATAWFCEISVHVASGVPKSTPDLMIHQRALQGSARSHTHGGSGRQWKETGNQQRAKAHGQSPEDTGLRLLESAPGGVSHDTLNSSSISPRQRGKCCLAGSSSHTQHQGFPGAGHMGTLPSGYPVPDPERKAGFQQKSRHVTTGTVNCPSPLQVGTLPTFKFPDVSRQPTSQRGPFWGQRPQACSVTSFLHTRVPQAHPLSQFGDIPPSQHQPSERPIYHPNLMRRPSPEIPRWPSYGQ